MLVTGASGFIGQHCLTALCDAGFSVYAICRRKPAVSTVGVTYLHCDLRDERLTNEIFHDIRPAYLLHLAWYVEPGKYLQSDENLAWLTLSIRLARQFVECGGQRLVTAGSCAEYDWKWIPQNGKLDEKSPLAYNGSLYSTTKISLGSIVESYLKQHGLSAAHARLFYLFGPGESSKRLVPQAISSIRQGVPFVLKNDGFVRDYLYVKDVASACACLLDSHLEGAVNIGSGQGCRLSDLLGELENVFSTSGLVHCQNEHSCIEEPDRIIADIQKLESIGWSPRFSLPMAMKDYFL